MCSERKHGLSTEQFPVSAYVGSSKNLKDLKGCCNKSVNFGVIKIGLTKLVSPTRLRELGGCDFKI